MFWRKKTSSRCRNQTYIKKDLLSSLWLMIKNYDLQCLKTLLSASTLNLYKNLCYLHNFQFLMLLVVLCEAYLAPEGREDEKRLFLKEKKRIIIWLLLSDHSTSSSLKKKKLFLLIMLSLLFCLKGKHYKFCLRGFFYCYERKYFSKEQWLFWGKNFLLSKFWRILRMAVVGNSFQR